MPPENPYEPVPQTPHYVPHHPAPNVPAPKVVDQTTATPGTNDFTFILDPPKPPRRPLFSGANLWQRMLLAMGALILLIIIINVVKGLFSSTNVPELISVAQDQQALIHIASKTTNPTNSQRINTSAITNNVAFTSKLSLTSAQGELLTYLKTNGHKTDVKVLSQKISLATDTQLTTSGSAGTYDATFSEVMSSRLAAYKSDLKLAYAKTKGPRGRQLLTRDYNDANLLITQLNTPAE